MKKTIVKIAAALTFTTLIAVASACNSNGENGNDTTDTPTQPPASETTPPPENGNNQLPVDLEIAYCELFNRPLEEIHNGALRPITAEFTETPMDLRGREIRVLTANIYSFTDWYRIDETPNETRHIMSQLRNIEDDYNMVFDFTYAPRAAGAWDILNAERLAGINEHAILNLNIFHAPLDRTIAEQELVRNLSSPNLAPIFDFENNPWNPGTDIANMFGRQYGVHFVTTNSGEILGSMIIFNRTLQDTLLPLGTNLYEMVHNHTWNFSNFELMLRWVQSNSNNTVLPLASHMEEFIGPGFIFANGGRIIESDPVHGLSFIGDTNENALAAIHFLAQLEREGLFELMPGNLPGGASIWPMLERAAAGGIMFMVGEYDLLRILTRHRAETGAQVTSEFNFGLLPIPMGDHMDDYVAAMMRYDMFHIVYDAHNPEEIAAILVAMANRLSKLNIIEHEHRVGVQDNESIEILEMMLERRVFDYSRLTRARSSVQTAIRLAITNTQTPVVALQTVAPTIEAQLAAFNDRMHN